MRASADLQQAGLLDGLIDVGAELSGADRDAVRSLAGLLLSRPPNAATIRGRSGLNNDGSPLELCLSSFADACRYRFVADPASTLDDPHQRRDASLLALSHALAATRSSALEPLCQATLAAIIPTDDVLLSRYVDGVLWLGAGINMPGIALYADLTKGEAEERWLRSEAWLSSVLANPAPARTILSSLRGTAELMAAGIEGTEPGNARAKLFFRIPRSLSLAELGVPGLADASISSFLAMLLGERELPLTGLVFSTSFLVANGAPFDAKADVCAHCLGYSIDEWTSFIDAATRAFSLTPMPARQALSDGRVQPAFVGLNRNGLGQFRLDLFLKPSSWYTGHADG